MKIRIINNSSNSLPEYSTHSSAGLDLRADIEKNITLEPFERALVKTGLSIELPEGYEAQIRPRSGLAYKNGVTVLNSPGTIDADFRGNIGVILINLSNKTFTINKGDRIAQMVISRYNKVSWKEASILEETKRGDEGFGSTGKK